MEQTSQTVAEPMHPLQEISQTAQVLLVPAAVQVPLAQAMQDGAVPG